MKKKTKTKKKKISRVGALSLNDHPISSQDTSVQLIQKPQDVKLSLSARIEQKTDQLSELGLKHGTYLFFVSALILIILALLQVFTANNPRVAIVYVMAFPLMAAVLGFFICGLSVLTKILLGYRKVKRTSESHGSKALRGILKAALWAVPKLSIWAIVGTIVILLSLGGQINFSSVQMLLKQYNPFALSLFTIGLMFFPMYTLYLMYMMLIMPFVNAIRESLGLSKLPKVPWWKELGWIIGGYAVSFTLLFISAMIDSRMLILLNNLVMQLRMLQATHNL